jgi:hypothetical protein
MIVEQFNQAKPSSPALKGCVTSLEWAQNGIVE